MNTITKSIIWKRLDIPGHESAHIKQINSNWYLTGTAVFIFRLLPCRLNYEIICNPKWETQSAKVSGWLGNDIIDKEIIIKNAKWTLNGNECPDVHDCLDIDLNFSPSTNLLPIRRLNLNVGEKKEVVAAWLRYPGFNLEPLVQTYERLDKNRYKYSSAGGKFTAKLDVDEYGFVLNYANIWKEEK